MPPLEAAMHKCIKTVCGWGCLLFSLTACIRTNVCLTDMEHVAIFAPIYSYATLFITVVYWNQQTEKNKQFYNILNVFQEGTTHHLTIIVIRKMKDWHCGYFWFSSNIQPFTRQQLQDRHQVENRSRCIIHKSKHCQFCLKWDFSDESYLVWEVRKKYHGFMFLLGFINKCSTMIV